MLCNICQKNNATIHFKGIFNNQIFKLNLCEECAKKKGMEFKPEISLPDLLSTLSDLDLPTSIKAKKTFTCSTCGTSYAEFKQTGQLGCSNCYKAFSEQIIPLLERIHGSTRHIGKKHAIPAKIESMQDISTLKRELEEALKKEEYERAAHIRDKIKELEK